MDLIVSVSGISYVLYNYLQFLCLHFFFDCMSVIAMVLSCLVIVSYSSLLLLVPREGCASRLWHFMGISIYIFSYTL